MVPWILLSPFLLFGQKHARFAYTSQDDFASIFFKSAVASSVGVNWVLIENLLRYGYLHDRLFSDT